MNYNLANLQLSGKGFMIESKEWPYQNIRLIANHVEFHELVIDDKRVGWITTGELTILADFIKHTLKGMEGESMQDIVKSPIVIDEQNIMHTFIPKKLVEVDTSSTQELIDGMNLEKYKNNIHIDFDIKNDEELLVIFSTRSDYVLVQSDKRSIRIYNDLYILDWSGEEDKLTHIGMKDGVFSFDGEKNIKFGKGKIIIDNKEFDPEAIIKETMNKVGETADKLSKAFALFKQY